MQKHKSFFSRLLQGWKKLGPGLVTGASDDDPSGIATYSQAGAAFGLATLWTAIIAFPLMAAIQQMCARIGLTAPVLIAIILHISNNKKIMGENVNGIITNILGLTALVIMTAAAVALIYLQFTD
jgi:Mn2+/Fe2+ NRAMP family transporter